MGILDNMSKKQFTALMVIMILLFSGVFILIFWHPGEGFITRSDANWWTDVLCIEANGALNDNDQNLYHTCTINQIKYKAEFDNRWHLASGNTTYSSKENKQNNESL